MALSVSSVAATPAQFRLPPRAATGSVLSWNAPCVAQTLTQPARGAGSSRLSHPCNIARILRSSDQRKLGFKEVIKTGNQSGGLIIQGRAKTHVETCE